MSSIPSVLPLSFGVCWLMVSLACCAALWGRSPVKDERFLAPTLADHYEPWDNNPGHWKVAAAFNSESAPELGVTTSVELPAALPISPSVALDESAMPTTVVPGLRVVWLNPHPRRAPTPAASLRQARFDSYQGEAQGRFLRSADKSAINLDIRQAFSPRS